MPIDDFLEDLRAAGRVDSAGAFTMDLALLEAKLSRYQLPSLELYPLLLVSAAVSGGAGKFRSSEGMGRAEFWWDSSYAEDELRTLLNHLESAEARLADLALAVNAARRLGELEVASGTCRLTARPDHYEARASQAPVSGTVVRLQRAGWSRWKRILSRRTPALERAVHAPLEGLPRPVPRRVPWAVRLGHPPGRLEADRWYVGSDQGVGPGYLFPSREPSLVVVRGLAHSVLSPHEGIQLLAWHDLPLDLSHLAVRLGTAWQEWQAVFLRRCLDAVMADEEPELLAWVLQEGRRLRHPAVMERACFRNSLGQSRSLQEVEEDYRRHGVLGLVSRCQPCAWEPERVLVAEHAHERLLPELFRSTFNFDGLAREVPRLPNPDNYLVRMPCLHGHVGEMGLRRFPTTSLRAWSQGHWVALKREPYGLEYAGNSSEPRLTFPPLYSCLDNLPEDAQVCLQRLYGAGHIPAEDRLAFLANTWLPTHFGSSVRLSELTARPNHVFSYTLHDRQWSLTVLVLDRLAAAHLRPLLHPTSRLEELPDGPPARWTAVARHGIHILGLDQVGQILLSELFRTPEVDILGLDPTVFARARKRYPDQRLGLAHLVLTALSLEQASAYERDLAQTLADEAEDSLAYLAELAREPGSWALELAEENDYAPILDAPWFRPSDGTATSFREIREVYSRDGILLYRTRPGPGTAPLLEHLHELWLLRRFPNSLNLDGAPEGPSLPNPADYLVILPLVDKETRLQAGQMGLPRRPQAGLRQWRDGHCRGFGGLICLDVASDVPLEDLSVHSLLLYSCLLERPAGAGEWHAYQIYWCSFFHAVARGCDAALQAEFEKIGLLRTLLEHSHRVFASHPTALLKPEYILRTAENAHLPLAGGGTLSLAQVARLRDKVFYTQKAMAGLPADALVLLPPLPRLLHDLLDCQETRLMEMA